MNRITEAQIDAAAKALCRLKRWRSHGDGPVTYVAGSKQFSDDVIVLLEEIERLSDQLGQAHARIETDGRELAELRAAFNEIGQRATELQQLDICRLAMAALEQKAAK